VTYETWTRVEKAEWPAWSVPQVLGCLRRQTHVLVQYIGDVNTGSSSHWALYYDGNLFVATHVGDAELGDAELGKWADARLSQLGPHGSMQWHATRKLQATTQLPTDGKQAPVDLVPPQEGRSYQLKPRKEKDLSLPRRSKKKFGLHREDDSDNG